MNIYYKHIITNADDGSVIEYDQLYLALNDKTIIAIKPIYKADKALIKYLISSNLVKELKKGE